METLSILGIDVSRYLSAERLLSLIRVAALLLIGIPALHVLRHWIRKIATTRLAEQPGVVAGKIVYYSGLCIIILSALNELGFNLSTFLGAAGIVGIAIGFASQTSVSNIISGLFIMLERPFVVNDMITIDQVSGQVLSIDMLSVKLRTDDNRFVRVPNEMIIKNKLTNSSRFPIRRLDINLGVSYQEDIGRVRSVLMDIAHKNNLCLQEPVPVVILSGFGESAILFRFAVWATQENMISLRNTMYDEIKRRFDEERIELPFPHMSLYSGTATAPFPIRIVAEPEVPPRDAAHP